MERLASLTRMATMCHATSYTLRTSQNFLLHSTKYLHSSSTRGHPSLRRFRHCLCSAFQNAGVPGENEFIVRHFHTSSCVASSKLKNTKNKTLKPVTFKPKTSRGMVSIFHNMTVQELADAMSKDVDHVYEVMLYVPGTDHYDEPQSPIDDIAVIKEIVKKSGMRFKFEERKKTKEKENKDEMKRPPAPAERLLPRPPVVTIMGHVDHGKTTLLDTIRHSHVVDSEFGGITQHIGAFSVSLATGEKITFLDTPGHAAFHTMRSRGAHVTDLVILVVAADDGVMKQTAESIKHAQEADVPIIVAINKVDKAEADVERVRRGLMEHGIVVEEMGGDVQDVPVSALEGTGIDRLQEAILAQAELMEIKADFKGLLEGAVIESSTDIGRGKLATLLVQRGTLRKGSVLVAGTAWAKVRGMFNDRGKPVMQAKPGEAVEVIGWRDLPHAGQEVLEVESERRANEVITWRKSQEKDEQATLAATVAMAKQEQHQKEYQAARAERLARGYRKGAIARKTRTKETTGEHEGPELAVVLKGDVDGSVEAILEVLDTYTSDQCRLHLLSYGVGTISEHDVEMAANFNGVIYAFNVSGTPNAMKAARQKNVDIREHNIIYKMVDDIRYELTQRIEAEEVEKQIGTADVLQIFMVSERNKKVPVAGCRCRSGQLSRKKLFQVLRDNEVVFNGELSSLKHFKNEVETIKMDVECGIMFSDHSFMPQPGDAIVCYELAEEQPELDWDLEF